MQIVEIFPPCLYSMKYGEDDDEYHRIWARLTDIDDLTEFFEKHQAFLRNGFWRDRMTPETAAAVVVDEIGEFYAALARNAQHACEGRSPDLEDLFVNFGGMELYEWKLPAVKAYGARRPFLIRLYAIRLDANCYLLIAGGIKLGPTIQDSPGLEDVLPKLRNAKTFLLREGILGQEDI